MTASGQMTLFVTFEKWNLRHCGGCVEKYDNNFKLRYYNQSLMCSDFYFLCADFYYEILFQALTSQFCILDRDGDRLISAEEKALFYKDQIQSGVLTSEEALCSEKSLFRNFDTYEDGKINLKQYLEFSDQVLFFKYSRA